MSATASAMQFVAVAAVLLLQLRMVTAQQDPGGWLDGHNKRRQFYHAKYGKEYVPLGWSEELARSSREFAEYLVGEDCLFEHCSTIFGRDECRFGENLAMNWGGGPRDAENVLTRWTEDEEDRMGGHFTQVVWRGTQYVGCGVASGSCGHIQVCRYIKPGNCNGKNNFMNDYTPCSPDCPPEGCFDISDGGQGSGGEDGGNHMDSASSDSSSRDNSEAGDPGCSSANSDSSEGCPKSDASASSDSSSVDVTPAPSPPGPPQPPLSPQWSPPPPSPPQNPQPAPPPFSPAPNNPFEGREASWATSGGAEVFENGEAFDLEFTTLRFSASGGYSSCHVTDVHEFPYNPSGGNPIQLGDDDSKGLQFSGGFKFPFFGSEYDKIAIGSNGYITFTAMDYDHSSSLSDHFKIPRISGLFTDLLPAQDSNVSFKQFGNDAAAVTFENMAAYGVIGSRSNFQIVMHSSGDVILTWLSVPLKAKRRVVGLSSGIPPPELGSIDLSQQHATQACAVASPGPRNKLMCPLGRTLKLASYGGILTATCIEGSTKKGEMPCPMDEVSIKTIGNSIEVLCLADAI